MKKRIVALFLAILMACTLLPVSAFAKEKELKREVTVTQQPESVTVNCGETVQLTTAAAADLGKNEYMYYVWYDPDMTPMNEIIDITMDTATFGVITGLTLLPKIDDFLALYDANPTMLDGIIGATLEPNQPSSTTSFTATQTRRYQCIAVVYNIADMQSVLDILGTLNRSKLTAASLGAITELTGSKIYGYALSEPATVTVEHNFALSEALEPTCTEQGYTTHTCSCGESYVDNYIEPLGHNYVDGMCTRCGRDAIEVTSQPESMTAEAGENVVFSVEAAGNDLTYQWQYKTPTGTKWNTSSSTGAKTASLTVQATTARNGQQYRCVIKDADGNSLTSEPATLTIASAITITSQPKSTAAENGKNVTFTVAAAGDGLSYQWQYKTPTGTKWNTSSSTGAKTASLTVQATAARDGQQYRCIVKDADGNTLISEPATLTIASAITITSQPKSAVAETGKKVTFTVAAAGNGLSYQWQYKSPTGTKWSTSTSTGAKTSSLTVQATAARDGQQYRCVIKDADGNTLTSSAATLTIAQKLAITAQPLDIIAALGDTVTFKVTATGTELTYQWQYKTPTGTKWNTSTSTGAKTPELSVKATTTRDGQQYRCVIKDANGNSLTSDSATLTTN